MLLFLARDLCLVFGFPIMKSSLSFTNVKTIKIPAVCSVNNSELL